MRQRPDLPDGLKWKKLGLFRRIYELRGEDQRYGGLEWGNAFGTQARGEILESFWSFRRTGLFKPVVTARPAGGGAAAILRCSWSGGGILQLENGRRYLWKKMSFWGCEWAFLDETGAVVVRFRPEGILRCGGIVDLATERAQGADIPLLVLLGWYLKVLAEGDAAVAVAA
jgi:hypothetical protein